MISTNIESPVETIAIPAMFRGPPHSGNGGYLAGVFANLLTLGRHDLPKHSAVEVTLRAPTPLDKTLSVHRDGESLAIRDAEVLVANAVLTTLQIDVPIPASWDEALAVREQSYSLPIALHPHFGEQRRGAHPICFCCGAELAPTQGLHVYSAPVPHKHQVAAAWTANECFADETGFVKSEYVWTALDCPGQMAWRAEGTRTGMLGRLTAHIEKPIRARERCVVIGWTMGNEGRKYFAGTALFNEANELCAYAKAVWIGTGV
ncbi:MAG: hypothetical protein H7Y02_09890 [Candidatus Obscuribacterales bacterium]|nr:hypothetical protein [Steroidobacteraceae bacterium]